MISNKPVVSSNACIVKKQKLYTNLFKIQADPRSICTSFLLEISPELPPDDDLIPRILQLAKQRGLLKDLKCPLLLGMNLMLAGD